MTRLALFLALAATVALAQPQRATGDPAVERYHAGAQAYVNGDMARAKTAVDAGLRAAPNNARLQALRDLLEQEQEQDNQQGGGQDEQQQNPSGGESQESDEGESGQNQGQPPPDEPEAEQDQTRTEPQDPGQASEGGTPPEGSVEQNEMSRAQAERILDAVGGDERLLLRELRRAPTRGRRTDKDW